MTVAYMLEKQKAQKILFIVPNVSLVVQATEDFIDYNWRNQVRINIQQIYSGQKIKPNANVVIGTYQSLVKKDKEYFDDFDAVTVDETHKAKSQSIKTILEKCNESRLDYWYNLCIDAGYYKKWVSKDFDLNNKEKLVLAVGHYHFNDRFLKDFIYQYNGLIFANVSDWLRKFSNSVYDK